MSQNSAPSSLIASNSSTRCRMVAFVAFMLGHQGFDPCRVPIMQTSVVNQGELLAAGAVAAQVRTSFDRQCLPRGDPQGDNFRVRMAARGALLALAELGEGFLPQGSVVR